MFRTRERERETEGKMKRRVTTFAEECVLSATCIRAVTEPTPVLSENRRLASSSLTMVLWDRWR